MPNQTPLASCFTNSDDARLISLIEAAQKRVVFLAPGVSLRVAEALSGAWARLGPQAVTVILDADPEIYRLGYGAIEGLRLLNQCAAKAGGGLAQQPGVRLGLLISDDQTLIYTPTAQLFEGEPTDPAKPNGLLLSSAPAEIVRDIGLGDNQSAERKIGLAETTPSSIHEIEEDLKKNPPVQFDLARRVRVYTTKFQYVELELTNCYVSRQQVQIPTALLGLTKDEVLQNQLQTRFKLAETPLVVEINEQAEGSDVKRQISEETIKRKRKNISDSFLIPLKGYGNIVRRENKGEIEKAVEELRADIEAFQNGIEKALKAQIEKSVELLVKELLPKLKENPPKDFTKYYGSGFRDDQLTAWLKGELLHAFNDAAKAAKRRMGVSLIFKDVTIESLKDDKFRKIVKDARLDVDELHEARDAVEVNMQGAGI